ncbi:acyl-CoA dehydrogenase family protein [Catellatospora sp. KI3]|uniref:acyl-CoA dehydrogenase family protein n=1 Tax=Catellatospora sp. KI3 TaxID=3041620 RepID=UPI0024824344|nr:acyl-CoA dehydrogenase family protein [Catellatospora sp. KI3]MDI1463394.1 acyl-CoA dehydrogenase family protein [Catellatospora sp. KI3]
MARHRAVTTSAPHRHAHVLRDGAESLAAAAELAAQRHQAALDRLRTSGLLAITVPAVHGGADVGSAVAGEVVDLLAAADRGLAGHLRGHLAHVDALRRWGSTAQQVFFFAEVLAGSRFGGRSRDLGTGPATARLSADGPCRYRLDGTVRGDGSIWLADWIAVPARGDDGGIHLAYVSAGSPGVDVLGRWQGTDRRGRAGVTVRLRDVLVPGGQVIPNDPAPHRSGAPRPAVRCSAPYRRDREK